MLTAAIAALLTLTIPCFAGVALISYRRYRAEQRRVAELTALIGLANQSLLDLTEANIRLRRRPMVLNSQLYHAYRINPATIYRN